MTQILPPELEREIFEIAGYQSLQTAAELTRVAHRVQEWIEPILYGSFNMGHSKESYFPPFYLDGADKKSVTLDKARLKRHGRHIKNVLIQQRSSRTIKKVLDYCPKVENLALWLVDGQYGCLHSILQNLSLKSLSLDTLDFMLFNSNGEDSNPAATLSLNITHLDLVNFFSFEWEQTAMPPNLTHLSLSGIPDEGFIRAVLHSCPNLQLLVVNDGRKVREGVRRNLEAKIKDKRLVETSCSAEHSQYWSRGPQWGGDFWKVCEDVRDSRQSK